MVSLLLALAILGVDPGPDQTATERIEGIVVNGTRGASL